MMMQLKGNRKYNPYRVCRLTLILSLAVSWSSAATAAEVYTWTDDDGTVHYSDTPRADGQMEAVVVEEIYRPGSVAGPAVPAEVPPVTPEASPEAGAEVPLSAAEQRRQDIAGERSERREQQAEAERLCGLHRQRLEQMEPARRVFYTDDQGESVRMDDEQRMALIDESKAFLAKNCSD
jgi:hypothetical protein